MSLADSINWKKVDGLVPAVIQDESSDQVLMLGYMNKDALAKTLKSEKVTFWSRSKQRLWTKGESSGNSLLLSSIQLDCDQDTLLVKVRPLGPTCHKGTTSCFDSETHPTGKRRAKDSAAFLEELEAILASRKHASPDSSYTARLYSKGTKRIAQKVGEEGVEVALAAVAGDREELVNESADLLYHLLVLLQSQDMPLSEVMARLHKRSGQGSCLIESP